MNTLEQLEKKRDLQPTRYLGFPEWFDPSEWEVNEYVQGGTLCKDKGITLDWFDVHSFVKREKCQVKKELFIQSLSRSEKYKEVKFITLKRKK